MTEVLITIDSEVGDKARFAKNGFDNFFLGKFKGKEYGVRLIMNLLEDHDIKGEFFVDVYESYFYDEERYKRICKEITSRGHGVQLHTHPVFAYDKKRLYLFQYNLNEQKKIIKEGKGLIKKWIGIYPIAHRAGSYSADKNTLIALSHNNIFIDSSYNHRNSKCKLDINTINKSVKIGKILEIPITVDRSFAQYKRIILPFKKWKQLDITNINPQKLISRIKKLWGKLDYIVIMVHSSNFVKRSGSQEVVGVARKNLMTFKYLLDFLEGKTIKFSDIK